MTISHDLKLQIPGDSYRKIMDYATACDLEITGFADCDYDSELGVLVVGDVYLLKQKAQDAEVEMDEETIANFTYQLVKEGVTQLPRLWWHSHVNMMAFFSGTDTATIDELDNETFMVALVVNKKEEMKCTVKICKPFPVILNDVEIEITDYKKEVPQEIIDEVAEKVEKVLWRGWIPKGKKGKKHSQKTWLGDDDDNYYSNYPNNDYPAKPLITAGELTREEWNHILHCNIVHCQDCSAVYPRMKDEDFDTLNKGYGDK